MDDLAQPGTFFVQGKEELDSGPVGVIVKREGDRVLLLVIPTLEFVWVNFQTPVTPDKRQLLQPIQMPEKTNRRFLKEAVMEAYKDVVFEEVIHIS